MELRFEGPKHDHPFFISQIPFRKILRDKISIVNSTVGY
jgi:hypothetical protein